MRGEPVVQRSLSGWQAVEKIERTDFPSLSVFMYPSFNLIFNEGSTSLDGSSYQFDKLLSCTTMTLNWRGGKTLLKAGKLGA